MSTAQTDRIDRDDRTEAGAPVSAPAVAPAGTTPEDELIATLRSLRELGRFEQAAALVREADAAGPAGRMSPVAHAVAGPALAAVSDYPAAAVHLTLASADPVLAPAALAGLAELAWVRHDHARARRFALAGLTLEPTHRGCRIQLSRAESGLRAQAEPERTGGLAHAAFHPDPLGNAGDRALTEAVRACFTGAPALSPESPGDGGWSRIHVHQVMDEPRLAAVNRTEGLVVGGGGLFLPDTAPNGNSGWQWNVADEMLTRIRVPLVVFAVGYNMFAGQTFEPEAGGGRFTRALRALVERAEFVGLRNHGSLERVRAMLPAGLAEKVVWQPCPTAFADLLPLQNHENDLEDGDSAVPEGAVLLNCAFDRAGRRFGDGYRVFLSHLARWVTRTGDRAPVHYVAHCVDDERFVVDLRREHGITLPVVPMYRLSASRMRALYRRAALVVGMRGHAVMIPFGCGTPVVSLISHPKLGFFLEDVQRPEWGLDVHDPHLAQRLGELTDRMLDERPALVQDITRLQHRLAEVTSRNLSSLPSALRPVGSMGQDSTGE